MTRRLAHAARRPLLLPLIAALVALAASAAALTWREVTETCPLTGQTFTRQTVNSYSRFGMQLDLKPIGALVAPLPPPVCPDSGFVVYRENFSEADIAFFRALVATPEFQQIRARNTDYFVAAYEAEELDEEPAVVAFLLLQATWEVDDETARYKHYARRALSVFDAYDRTGAEQSKSERWWAVKFLIVNLHRRLGEFDVAADKLAQLPLVLEPPGSAYRAVSERLGRLISERDPRAAEVQAGQP